jgi:peptidyl-prolyl isomerase G (cyclophilin G)
LYRPCADSTTSFRALCVGSQPKLNYALSPFHRIIDDFMVQGGDITRGDGTGGDSIYGGDFEDENLGWRDMDAAGLVCMANRGKATNSSQFFITLDECPHLNNKHTIFGRLVAGEDTLARMAKVQVNGDDKPLEPVLIARCGELERKKKAPVASPEPASKDRGRKNRRGSSANASRSPSPQPKRSQPVRRQSDHIIDENLRGRVRARSDDEDGESSAKERAIESDSQSPDSRYKRKRSPSPSRGFERKKASRDSSRSPIDSRRRRRSLPNQYYDHDAPTRSNDGDRRRPRENDRYRPGNGNGNGNRQHDKDDNRRGGRGGRNSYRPPQRQEEGRLGGDTYGSAGAGANEESTVKFKGRGHMKFREPDRRW